ncbi:GntR family transcriptional regulator [Paracidovorax wautersii]|uniref:DNA-binding GntR family transcriptional regulator n=1 Tax=Paracidovorax wautersii TaxID=1177982 RepID=A0ABU1I8W6_9BURK|nr:GntR family transcriptional regulator [Paracidovorax wautersii]MDR6213530.1 DNA-binding GntR family transcriptional regulator [Paracidovorax wautersii]
MATSTPPRPAPRPRAPARKKAAAAPQKSAALPVAALPADQAGALPGLRTGDDVETRIYNTVFESVMTQRLTPGTKLPEASLCTLFGVRRATVRKVLQTLAHDHIVELRPNRGAVVAAPSPEETRKIFEARRALEAAIVRLATRHATPEDLASLRSQLQQEHAAMHTFTQPAWARLASSFHLRLAELARNPILQRYLMELVSRCSLIVALYEPPGKASCEHEEHARVVDLIEQGDAEGAVAVMEEHLLELERSVCMQHEAPGNSLARMLGMA